MATLSLTYHHQHHNFHKKSLILNDIRRDRGMEGGVVKKYAGKNLDEHSQIETQSFITGDPYCDAKGRQDWWASIRRWGPSQGERSPKHNNNLDRNGPDAKSPLQSEKYWTFSSILSLLRSHLLVIHIPFWFELANNAFFMSLQRSGWLSKMDDILLGGHV